MRATTRYITIRVPEPLWRRFRVRVLEDDTTIQKVVLDMIESYSDGKEES